MKKLNITKEEFNKSKYFKNKYGSLEYVSESGKIFKTSKGSLLKFKESIRRGDTEFGKEQEKSLEEQIDKIYDEAHEYEYELMWDDELVDKLVTLQIRYAAITGHKYNSPNSYGEFHDEKEKKLAKSEDDEES